jgi:hypothetical protein
LLGVLRTLPKGLERRGCFPLIAVSAASNATNDDPPSLLDQSTPQAASPARTASWTMWAAPSAWAPSAAASGTTLRACATLPRESACGGASPQSRPGRRSSVVRACDERCIDPGPYRGGGATQSLDHSLVVILLLPLLNTGAFAVWGLCFASFDCSIAAIRKKEDPWNAILSGACTGGLLAIRGASPCAALRACVGAAIHFHLSWGRSLLWL